MGKTKTVVAGVGKTKSAEAGGKAKSGADKRKEEAALGPAAAAAKRREKKSNWNQVLDELAIDR